MNDNVQVRLRARPQGVPVATDFEVVEGVRPQLGPGQVLVRNHILSVDPAMRVWLGPPGGYMAPVDVGEVMRAFAAAEVIESDHRDYQPGESVVGMFGWQTFAAVAPQTVMWKVAPNGLPLSLSLGVLGLNGITAYLGVTRICQPQPGETVVVSTAAGAVGSAAGQIAKILGARTVGVTGGALKCVQCRDEFGYDAAIDYKAAADLRSAILDTCSGGVDAYFDNTAGVISDAVRRHLNFNARLALCGTSSVPAWEPWPLGERVERHLLNKRALMKGFVVSDHKDQYAQALEQLETWVRSGQLRYREHILQGIEQAPASVSSLYDGANTGKLLIRL